MVVVGLDGVGSHTTNMLARAGVGRLRLVDFDNVTVSSLNRNACARRADVGLPKVEVCRQYFADVLPPPHQTVETVNRMFTAEAAAELLGGQPDYVVDAIDDTNTKAALIQYCVDHKLPIIISAGAGACGRRQLAPRNRLTPRCPRGSARLQG